MCQCNPGDPVWAKRTVSKNYFRPLQASFQPLDPTTYEMVTNVNSSTELVLNIHVEDEMNPNMSENLYMVEQMDHYMGLGIMCHLLLTIKKRINLFQGSNGENISKACLST